MGGGGKEAYASQFAKLGSRKPFTMPGELDVAAWLKRAYQEKGLVKGLCCELVLRAGIRAAECVAWQASTLDKDPSKWVVRRDKVIVDISAGTKGTKAFPLSVYGPSRRIRLPIGLAMRMHRYRTEQRVSQLGRLRRVGADIRGRDGDDRLFLGETSSAPFTARMLHKAWASISGGFNRWNPRAGRHFWAGTELLEHARERVRAIANQGGTVSSQWMYGSLQSDCNMIIRPQLGHVSPETTRIYIEWVLDQLPVSGGSIAESWSAFLDEDEL